MNRTIKEATVRRYHYPSHATLREHLAKFLDAYNFARASRRSGASSHTKPSATPSPTTQPPSPATRST